MVPTSAKCEESLHLVKQLHIKICPRNTELCQITVSHRAHAGVFNIHPNRVRYHFIVTSMVVGDDAERWQHFFGDGKRKGNQYLTTCPETAIFEQLTSAHDLGAQIYK